MRMIETRRLILRQMEAKDLPELAEIMQDEQTMYAYEGAFDDAETQAWFVKQQENYVHYGYGLWAVVLKETGTLVGQCGLTWQKVNNVSVLELGYLFNRNYWHQGLAIEAARACKDYAFEELRTEEVYSIIRETNVASMNVAIRNGMLIRQRFVKHYRGIDMPHYAFSVRKSELEILNSKFDQ